MANTDYDSGLPIRSEVDGVDERVQVKLVGGDAADLGDDAANQVIVDADGNAHIEVHGNNTTGADRTLQLSNLGCPNTDGVYDGTDNLNPANVALVAMERSDTPADSQQTLRLTAKPNTDGSVRSLDVALRDENGEPFTQANPLPVVVGDTEGGVPVHEEKTQLAAAKDTPITWDYLVDTDDTLYIHQVLCSASGKARWELLIGDGGDPTETFTKKAVRFNSTAFPNPDITLSEALVVVGSATGTHVRIIFENKDNGVQDLSATIVGTLVAA